MVHESSAQVVLHYRDGHTVRCTLTEEFSPQAAVVSALASDGCEVRVTVDDLKALFFLKTPRQRGTDMEFGANREDLPGSAVARVEFFDGEIIHGRVQHYSIKNKGFFLYPAASESNNQRIFVVARSLVAVDIES